MARFNEATMARRQCVNRTLRFSARAVEALPAPTADHPSSNIEYTDAAERGLRLAVYKSGNRSFRHRYTYRGRKRMMTLGEFPAVSIERSRERVRANKALLSEDIDPADERERIRQAPTFREFAEEQFLPFAREARRSYKDIESRLRRHLLPAFGKRQLSQITRREIAEFHRRVQREVSSTTANRSLALLSGMLTRAEEWGLVKENPAKGIKKFKENESRKRVLSGDELGRFLQVLLTMLDTPSGQAIYALVLIGVRKMELLSILKSNLDLVGKRVFLPKTKSGRPRYAVLNGQAVELFERMLEERKGDSDWVFPSPTGTGHLREVRRTFATVCDKAGITGLRLHDLRRTHASILINSGKVSIMQVRDILGHSDVRTTQIYTQMSTSALEEASEVASVELSKALDAVA